MDKVITKQDILEIIDDTNNLMGDKDTPPTGSNKETEAGRTTDYNAKVHGQNFKNDFLGRFGFYFYESEGAEKPEIVEELEFVVGEAKTKEVLATIKPFVEEALDSMGGIVTEGKTVNNKKVEDTLAKIMYEKYKETLKHYHENPEKLESDYKLHQKCNFDTQPKGSREHDYEWAKDILKTLKPHMKGEISEAKVVEDKLTDKRTDNDIVKKKERGLAKMEKVADLLAKLPKNDLDKLMNLLEVKKKK
jgi:hypothetical protein